MSAPPKHLFTQVTQTTQNQTALSGPANSADLPTTSTVSDKQTLDDKPSLDVLTQQLVDAFNASPFIQHNHMRMVVDDGIKCVLDNQPALLGNTAFQILHGGVAATMLDSIGGIEGMYEIYRRGRGSFMDQKKQAARLATVDLRIDYLAPGRGNRFVASAEVIRIGRKGHTARMNVVNDQDVIIATGIGSYAF